MQQSPPFVTKLFEIVESPSAGSIGWGSTGETVVVCDPVELSQDVLPRFFKHANISSFVRQLNIYGFQRCRTSQAQVGQLEFFNEKFARGREDLVRQITRGQPSQKRKQLSPSIPIDVAGLRQDCAAIHGQIETLVRSRSYHTPPDVTASPRRAHFVRGRMANCSSRC